MNNITYPMYIWPNNYQIRRLHLDDEATNLANDYKWTYIRVQEATERDEDNNCSWCVANGNHPEPGYLHFHKGDIIAREQFSSRDFESLHLTCALLKLQRIREEFDMGYTKLSTIIESTGNQVRRNERDY